MPSPTTYPQFINGILDRTEQKLRTDARIPTEIRANVVRSRPMPSDNRPYPILYFEDGEDDPEPFTTSGRHNHSITFRLTVMVKEQNPVHGVKRSRDATLSLVEALTGTLDDRRLLDDSGQALAQNVETRQRWGELAVNLNDEYIWVGTVVVTITADFRS